MIMIMLTVCDPIHLNIFYLTAVPDLLVSDLLFVFFLFFLNSLQIESNLNDSYTETIC